MKVYGADFSGARDASRGIYYAEGIIGNGAMTVNRVTHCDDRLDLLAAIHFSKAPWGLDFPFSVPWEVFKILQLKNWNELLADMAKYSRKEFDSFIAESGVPSCEARCRDGSICCRAVDASINSFSPLKRTNPNMRAMTYAGLKLLSYLRKLGNVVYPFNRFNENVSRLYEVYPSNTWHQAGFSRSADLKQFTERFTCKYDFRLEVEEQLLDINSLDAADAVVACFTMGYAMYSFRLENDWGKKHGWISDVEWSHRYNEGLIVKVC